MTTIFRRFAERFALMAFGLYHIPLFLNNYPSLGGGGFSDKGLAVSWGHLFTPVGIWAARHLFGMTGPMPGADSGDNGDLGEEWARLVIAVAIGLVAAAIWTAADRARPRGGWVEGTLRVLLRYSIALGLASYAIAKIVPQQFPPLDAMALETRVGDLAPMRLLWYFMQYSRPYNFFGGFAELLAVLLLCYRRTATLGALVGIGVMTNVALLNWAYDVPVKLYATMLVVSCAVLILYDAPRLIAVLVTNRTAPAPTPGIELQDRIPAPARWTIKLLLVGSVIASSFAAMLPGIAARSRPSSPIDGAWLVTSFARNGQSLDSTGNPARWRRFIVSAGGVAIRFETDSLQRCRRTAASDSTTVAFACSRNRQGELRWTRAGDVIQLTGSFDGAPISGTARHLGEADYPLMRSRMRIIFDR